MSPIHPRWNILKTIVCIGLVLLHQRGEMPFGVAFQPISVHHQNSTSTIPPVPSPTHDSKSKGASCADANENCAAWAQDGECAKNPVFMHFNCASSCGTCPHAQSQLSKLTPRTVPLLELAAAYPHWMERLPLTGCPILRAPPDQLSGHHLTFHDDRSLATYYYGGPRKREYSVSRSIYESAFAVADAISHASEWTGAHKAVGTMVHIQPPADGAWGDAGCWGTLMLSQVLAVFTVKMGFAVLACGYLAVAWFLFVVGRCISIMRSSNPPPARIRSWKDRVATDLSSTNVCGTIVCMVVVLLHQRGEFGVDFRPTPAPASTASTDLVNSTMPPGQTTALPLHTCTATASPQFPVFTWTMGLSCCILTYGYITVAGFLLRAVYWRYQIDCGMRDRQKLYAGWESWGTPQNHGDGGSSGVITSLIGPRLSSLLDSYADALGRSLFFPACFTILLLL